MLPQRKNIRLKNYDYATAGLYFITICCQDRSHLFGKIENGVLFLNDAGRMLEKWYLELEQKFPNKKCHEMVVMSNHFHCIIENIADVHDVADAHDVSDDHDVSDAHVGAPLRGRPKRCAHPDSDTDKYGMHNKKCNATIGDAMDWFKTMTTNEYIRGVKTLGWKRFNGKMWQRNYYDHIIRNEQAYERISEYILNNPKKWDEDKFYSKDC